MAAAQSHLLTAFRPLRRYGGFSGRASRLEFWGFQLLINLFGSVVELCSQIAGAGGLSVIAWLAFLLPSLAVGARRLHDTGRNGWWLLAPWTPFVLLMGLSFTLGSGRIADEAAPIQIASFMIILLLVLSVGALVLLFAWFSEGGTAGPNRYGDDPLETTDVAAIFT